MEIDSANEGIIVDLILNQDDIKELLKHNNIVCVDDLGWPPIKGRKIMVRLTYDPDEEDEQN